VPASHESPAGTAPSVLLVEEYDALSAAITSALKKFAPRHRIHVVESLAEAQKKAGDLQPQLIIADFDPPLSDAVNFVSRMSAAHPDARFLAIGSGVPPQMNAERYGPNALQFIEKPFDLAEFGAAVQALLGPWTDATSGDSRGTLRDLNPRDLIPLQCLNLASSVLHLRSQDDGTGEIHFVDGQVTHAATGKVRGARALLQMLRWQVARADEAERDLDAPRTIHGSWTNVFFEALRDTKTTPVERKPPVAAASPVVIEAPKPAAKARTGKKVVIIDDTEMLLIFVEDTLAIAEPDLQIVTAFTGSEGVRRAEVMLPDLVLLDYSLPDLRGDQVCERLLENETTARIPVVMMSGHVSEMAATARKYRNVVATIAKPFMSDALVTIVRETLAKGSLPAHRPAPAASVPKRQGNGNGNGRKPAKKNGASVQPKEVATEKPVPAPAPPPPEPMPPPPAMPSAPVVTPPPSPIQPPAPPPVAAAPAVASALAAFNGSTVVLGLGMEVLSVQFTPQFRIGTLRARPTTSNLSLTHSSAPSENLLAGFEIGSVELDADGRINLIRVVPTRQPPTAVHPHNAFHASHVALLNQNASIEVTAGPTAPMTMQAAALFKVAGVELSDRFEVAQLVLRPAGNRVRVNLDPRSHAAAAGTEFETTLVRLDSSRRIAEFVLNAAHS
jgi:DNA-binding response OmpR family regulator